MAGGAGTRTCVGTWFQCLFSLLGFDGVSFVPPYEKVCKGGCVIDVIVFAPINNMGCTKAPVDETINEPDGVLITETPEVIVVSTG